VIDPGVLRDQPDLIRASLDARGESAEALARAQDLDASWREAISAFETLRAEQNAMGKEVAAASGEEKQKLVAAAKELAERVKQAQAELADSETQAKAALWALPNLIVDGVPSGDESNFVVRETRGEEPTFDFPVRDHLELAEPLGIIDMERGAKVAGSRFYYLVGTGALLENALMQRAIQVASAAGFQLMMPPTLVRPEIMQGTGFLGEHASEVYT
jgi:Seryl-tRNA synthetase